MLRTATLTRLSPLAVRHGHVIVEGLSEGFLLSASQTWSRPAGSQDELVEVLSEGGLLTDAKLAAAMRSVDRAHFQPEGEGSNPYEQRIIYLGYGASMATPAAHASALSTLLPSVSAGGSFLDIGAGTGIIAAYAAAFLGSSGRVAAVEHVEPLAEEAKQATARALSSCKDAAAIDIVCADGRELPSRIGDAQWDAIHVGAAVADRSTLAPLLSMLAPNGRLLAPVGAAKQEQQLLLFYRDGEEQAAEETLATVIHEPLTSRELQGALTAAEKKEAVKAALQQWKEEFASKHGRPAGRDDLSKDARASELLAQFSRLSGWQ
eukprot:PLAT3929.1.p2 GENE.PLAT3929.1~~PLAT3929.1.p2  ORF type:complete len:321 (+),score=121.99 PLAT3929.1:60-1022(+)